MERAIGAKAEDRDTALAQTLKKQLGKDPSKLNRISGYAVDYIGRLFCLLYHKYFLYLNLNFTLNFLISFDDFLVDFL